MKYADHQYPAIENILNIKYFNDHEFTQNIEIKPDDRQSEYMVLGRGIVYAMMFRCLKIIGEFFIVFLFIKLNLNNFILGSNQF